MQIVIDIDEEIYNHMKERFMYGYADTELDKVGLAVRNGTPLPKGHGRLIDADRLLRPDMIRMCYHLKNGDIAMPIVDIEHAETVIPADKEGD